MEVRLKALLNTAQPNAVAFGGLGISGNPARWCGTEGGDPPGWPDIWATDCGAGYGPGCPTNSTNAVWNPSGVDFTLQSGDHWLRVQLLNKPLVVHPTPHPFTILSRRRSSPARPNLNPAQLHSGRRAQLTRYAQGRLPQERRRKCQARARLRRLAHRPARAGPRGGLRCLWRVDKGVLRRASRARFSTARRDERHALARRCACCR